MDLSEEGTRMTHAQGNSKARKAVKVALICLIAYGMCLLGTWFLANDANRHYGRTELAYSNVLDAAYTNQTLIETISEDRQFKDGAALRWAPDKPLDIPDSPSVSVSPFVWVTVMRAYRVYRLCDLMEESSLNLTTYIVQADSDCLHKAGCLYEPGHLPGQDDNVPYPAVPPALGE